MADERVAHASILVDGTTRTQQANVNASGRLEVDIAENTGIGVVSVTAAGDVAHDGVDSGNPVKFGGYADSSAPTAVAIADRVNAWFDLEGRLQIGDGLGSITVDGTVTADAGSGTFTVDSELATAAALSDTFANPTTAPVGAFLMGYDGTDWQRIWGLVDGDTVAAGATGILQFGSDGSNYLPIAIDASGQLQVDVLSVAGAIDTELPAAGALADDTANPTTTTVGAAILGYDSGNTNWNRVEVDDAGHLQVDILTGGGSDNPTTPAVEALTTTGDLAAGGNETVDSADLPDKYLWGATLSGSVAFKATIYTSANNSDTVVDIVFGQAGTTVPWKPPHRHWAQAGSASGGHDGFAINWVNLDTSEAATLYANLFYADN
jgi:hypothetical protein